MYMGDRIRSSQKKQPDSDIFTDNHSYLEPANTPDSIGLRSTMRSKFIGINNWKAWVKNNLSNITEDTKLTKE